MDIYTAITTRRSIRRFTGQAISDNMLHDILNAGFCAPSAKNRRPWHFIVVKDRDVLVKLDETSEFGHMVKNSAFSIVVCGDTAVELQPEFTYEDCSAAMQNMLLCAHGLGLGAVWCGIFSEGTWYPKIKEILAVPGSARLIGLAAFGYPDEQRAAPDRFVQNKIHYDKW